MSLLVHDNVARSLAGVSDMMTDWISSGSLFHERSMMVLESCRGCVQMCVQLVSYFLCAILNDTVAPFSFVTLDIERCFDKTIFVKLYWYI
jgi:hypothetical protein